MLVVDYFKSGKIKKGSIWYEDSDKSIADFFEEFRGGKKWSSLDMSVSGVKDRTVIYPSGEEICLWDCLQKYGHRYDKEEKGVR